MKVYEKLALVAITSFALSYPAISIKPAIAVSVNFAIKNDNYPNLFSGSFSYPNGLTRVSQNQLTNFMYNGVFATYTLGNLLNPSSFVYVSTDSFFEFSALFINGNFSSIVGFTNGGSKLAINKGNELVASSSPLQIVFGVVAYPLPQLPSEPDPPSVPEPSFVLGIIGMGVLTGGALLKQKLNV